VLYHNDNNRSFGAAEAAFAKRSTHKKNSLSPAAGLPLLRPAGEDFLRNGTTAKRAAHRGSAHQSLVSFLLQEPPDSRPDARASPRANSTLIGVDSAAASSRHALFLKPRTSHSGSRPALSAGRENGRDAATSHTATNHSREGRIVNFRLRAIATGTIPRHARTCQRRPKCGAYIRTNGGVVPAKAERFLRTVVHRHFREYRADGEAFAQQDAVRAPLAAPGDCFEAHFSGRGCSLSYAGALGRAHEDCRRKSNQETELAVPNTVKCCHTAGRPSSTTAITTSPSAGLRNRLGPNKALTSV